MRYINWFWRTVLFIALLGFAVKNDQSVTVRYFFGYEWQLPLVFVLLMFFSMGAGVGVLTMLVNVFRQRREISRLKRDLQIERMPDEVKQA